MTLSDDYLARFGGIGRLYGADALPKLAAAHVCVIGVGGVGSWVVEALARSGIGRLTMIDLDDVCVTNINRQLPALRNTIGRPKVDVLAERARAINPACEVNAITEFVTDATAERLLDQRFDFVIDAVDRMSIKALIIGICHRNGTPVLTVGSAGGRRDPTQIKTVDLGLAGRDLLLQQTRRKLRRDFGFPKSTDGDALVMGVPCVFSTEKPVFPWADGSCSTEPEPGADESLRLDCASGFGAATFVTGAFAFVAAAEVVRRIVTS
jgi:tRNA A37 threonylcarbamoyladenosine dehydratase